MFDSVHFMGLVPVRVFWTSFFNLTREMHSF